MSMDVQYKYNVKIIKLIIPLVHNTNSKQIILPQEVTVLHPAIACSPILILSREVAHCCGADSWSFLMICECDQVLRPLLS